MSLSESLEKCVWAGWKAKEHRCAFIFTELFSPTSVSDKSKKWMLSEPNLSSIFLPLFPSPSPPLSILPPIVQDSSQWGREQWGLIVFCRYRGHQQRPAILGPGEPPYAWWNLFLLSWLVSFSVLACSLTSSCSETDRTGPLSRSTTEQCSSVQLSPASRTNRQPPFPISHPHNLMNRSGNL